LKVLVCGIDGYIGWPLALRLKTMGHKVLGLDNCWRRNVVPSGICIPAVKDRMTEAEIDFYQIDVLDINTIKNFPQVDVVVHLAEQPSAAWSMESLENCIWTHTNNLCGTLALLWFMKNKCPAAHLVKLGSMGEYGTPDYCIPENDSHFPKHPGSFYHCTKVHDSVNVQFACETWGLTATDVMQGIVYGTRTEETLTRFDYNECFGTVLNRFCAQAVAKVPLTIYGDGTQKRSFLSLSDSIQCLSLIIDNPPKQGEYRIINQFDIVRSINELAEIVSSITNADKNFVDGPRAENYGHIYEPVSILLKSFGYKPTASLLVEVEQMLNDLRQFGKTDSSLLGGPKIQWK